MQIVRLYVPGRRPANWTGINAIIVGARLLWMNVALCETERAREERLAQASGIGRRDA